MFFKPLIIIFLLALLSACYSPAEEIPAAKEWGQGCTYASGFSIETFPQFRILHVRDPWQGSSGIHFEYVLASDISKVPDSLRHLPMVQTPVSRVVCMSTTHVAMIGTLEKTGTIVGISGADYISNRKLRTRIEAGEVYDVGAEQSLNYERIVSLQPDVIISYGNFTSATSDADKSSVNAPAVPPPSTLVPSAVLIAVTNPCKAVFSSA